MVIKPKCKIHQIPLVCFCPACRGSITSPRKARAARRIGKLYGGRPRSKKSKSGRGKQ